VAPKLAYKLKAGTCYIEAQFTGTDAGDHNSDMVGVGLMPHWKGTVISNRLQFEARKIGVSRPADCVGIDDWPPDHCL
jgi:hypothetical protein